MIFIVIVTSYLIGAIPFSYILPKIFTKVDVRERGSCNVGATNVLVTTGNRHIAILAAFLDVAKGFVVVIAAKLFFVSDFYPYLAGFFAIVGHDFPVYLKFNGGKGVATTVGVIMAANPFAIWFCLIVYSLFIVVTKYLILSTIITLFFTPFILLWLGEGLIGFIFGIFFLLLALFVHRADLSRIIAGKEKKLSEAIQSV